MTLPAVTEGDFKRRVLDAPVPVLVQFISGSECTPCAEMYPIVEEALDVFSGDLLAVTVNANENPTLWLQYMYHLYQNQETPCFLLFRHGWPIGMCVGVQDTVGFKAWINRCLARSAKKLDLILPSRA